MFDNINNKCKRDSVKGQSRVLTYITQFLEDNKIEQETKDLLASKLKNLDNFDLAGFIAGLSESGIGVTRSRIRHWFNTCKSEWRKVGGQMSSKRVSPFSDLPSPSRVTYSSSISDISRKTGTISQNYQSSAGCTTVMKSSSSTTLTSLMTTPTTTKSGATASSMSIMSPVKSAMKLKWPDMTSHITPSPQGEVRLLSSTTTSSPLSHDEKLSSPDSKCQSEVGSSYSEKRKTLISAFERQSSKTQFRSKKSFHSTLRPEVESFLDKFVRSKKYQIALSKSAEQAALHSQKRKSFKSVYSSALSRPEAQPFRSHSARREIHSEAQPFRSHSARIEIHSEAQPFRIHSARREIHSEAQPFRGHSTRRELRSEAQPFRGHSARREIHSGAQLFRGHSVRRELCSGAQPFRRHSERRGLRSALRKSSASDEKRIRTRSVSFAKSVDDDNNETPESGKLSTTPGYSSVTLNGEIPFSSPESDHSRDQKELQSNDIKTTLLKSVVGKEWFPNDLLGPDHREIEGNISMETVFSGLSELTH